MARKAGSSFTVLVAIALAAAAPAAAQRPGLETIVQDDAATLHQPDAEVARSMATLKDMGVNRVRITAGWSVIAPGADARERPRFDARDPDAYPPRAWDNLDRAVVQARKAGLDVMIDVAFWAPLWATEGDPGEGRARWNIDPAALADFSHALATRYSGGFTPRARGVNVNLPMPAPSRDANFLEALFGGGRKAPAAPAPPALPRLEPLPRVDWWTVWNEPNHPGFVQPQWRHNGRNWAANSPHVYRRMVEAVYPAVKAVQPESTVLVGGTSSTGVRRPRRETDGIAPLRFVRELACVDSRLRPLDTPECEGYRPLMGDGFSHHPYSLMNAPSHVDSRNPDNLQIGALSRLTTTLDQLARDGRIAPAVAAVYLTEFGYESNPPDPIKPFTPAQQARFLSWSEYLAWRNPAVRSWPQFLLRDMGTVGAADAARGKREFGDWQSGLLFLDGSEKPAASSFRLALHAECEPRRRGRPRTVRIWGRVRDAREPREVQVLNLGAVTTGAGGVFLRRVPHVPGRTYRLESGGRQGVDVAPVGCGRRP